MMRPCYVYTVGKELEECVFHQFVTGSHIVAPSTLKSGHKGGVINTQLAIVETKNGKVKAVDISNIQFADHANFEYFWNYAKACKKMEDNNG